MKDYVQQDWDGKVIDIDTTLNYPDFDLCVQEKVPSQKITGLYGPSGSGKTRLIRVLVGFENNIQQRTNVQFEKTQWQSTQQSLFKKIHTRGIGYLSQTIDLFPHLNAIDNILFSINRLKIESQYTISEILDMADKLGIRDQLNKLPSQLSGGQSQRVAFLRAIVSARTLLVLDEPFSAVGEAHKPAMMQLLKSLNTERQLGIIFSSHSRADHGFLSDYLLTFDAGKLVQHGSYSALATDLTSQFAQSPNAVNTLTAVVEEFEQENQINRLRIGEHRLWASDYPLEKGHQVKLEISAQDISIFLSENDQSSMLNRLPVILKNSADISAHQKAVQLCFEKHSLIAYVTRKSFNTLQLKHGQSLFAHFKAVRVIPVQL